MKRICVVTATRAEYGLLKPLMHALNNHRNFELQLLVTGSHLSPEFGSTYKLIVSDGFIISEKVEMLLSADTGSAIVKSIGLGMIGFADSLTRLSPDAVVILGDRYEILGVATAAATLKIPIIHLHGGEITEGAYDDSFRHAISKLSHLHFTSTEEHRQRVIQLGEPPANVFNVGAIGIDNIMQLPLLNKEELEEDLKIKFAKYNYQITFHPETLATISAEKQFSVLLAALDTLNDSLFIFTKSNADTDGRVINQMIDAYVVENPHKSKAYSSLGSLRFLSVLRQCDAIIGNSSSGIIEAPSLQVATINLGDRQKGRTQATSIINCDIHKKEILKAIEGIKNINFVQSSDLIKNPYGDGNTTQRIMEILENIDLPNLIVKKFFDKKT